MDTTPAPEGALFLLIVAVTVVLAMAALAVIARRLLGMRIGLVRTVLAGLAALGLARLLPPVMDTAEPDPITPVWFLTVQIGLSVLLAMGFLVLAELVVPTGSLRPLQWLGGLRRSFQRSRRYAQVVVIAVRHGLGPYLRGRSLPERAEGRTRFALALRSALEEGGVTFVKLGQLLSTRRDLVPPEVADELRTLQDQVRPAAWEDVEAVIADELGAAPSEAFREFDPVPLAAASVAQVHRARLTTGQRVVVKVVRPRIEPTVERDLDIVLRIARSLEARTRWGPAVGLVDLATGFADAITEELNLRVEARNILALESAASPSADSVTLPTVHEHVSTRRLLVMDLLEGVPLGSAYSTMERPAADRVALARSLLGSMLRQVVDVGVFHADPHPGNVLVLRDGRLGLLDFGSVGRLDGVQRSSLEQLLLAVERGDPSLLRDSLLELVARPDELDEQRLERALGSFMARHLGPAATPSTTLFTDLFRIIADYGLAVPPGVAAVFRALATLEGTLVLLAPDFDIVGESRRFAAARITDDLGPDTIGRSAAQELYTLLPVLRRLPRRLDRITSALDQGRLGVNVRLFADQQGRRFLSGLVHLALLSILGPAIGVIGVLLLGTSGGPAVTETVSLYQLLGYNMLVLSAVVVLRVLYQVLRSSDQ